MTEQGYPRPQLRRADWICLDGIWDFALDPDTRWRIPAHVSWDAKILVPFAPETTASGIGESGFSRACWYRRTFEAPPLTDGDRLFLRFGAIDYSATVWVNGLPVARHEGGYTPCSVDVTRFLLPQREQEVVVRAQDEPTDLTKPRGKQDWKPETH